MRGSVSFDRAAAYYDATRTIAPEALSATIDLLATEFADSGRVLEIGVGTGQLALPLAAAGVRVIGIDLSRPMMDQLVRKAGGRSPVPLVQGDVTAMPLAPDSVDGAYARWVLHLIPDWAAAVTALCRTVAPGGTIVIDPGGYTGTWRELWLRFRDLAGPAAEPPGLDMRDPEVLDDAFVEHGATRRDLPVIRSASATATVRRFLEDTRAQKYSWTWRLGEEELGRLVDIVEAEALERWGDLDVVPEPTVEALWRAYDLPG
jgi:SAM-dependent methyltransferase